jgi:hypothetical protein
MKTNEDNESEWKKEVRKWNEKIQTFCDAKNLRAINRLASIACHSKI